MTSDLKIKANRANARASTGPKTRYGRTRSARNAFRHGLNVSVQADEVLCEEVQALALEIAGSYANARIQALAHRVAEAQIEVRRVRTYRLAPRPLKAAEHCVSCAISSCQTSCAILTTNRMQSCASKRKFFGEICPIRRRFWPCCCPRNRRKATISS